MQVRVCVRVRFLEIDNFRKLVLFGRHGNGCNAGFCRGYRVPLQSVVVQTAVRQQWIYSLSFSNFNELSYSDPPMSRCRHRGCSDVSCRRCRVPLQSAVVQGTVLEIDKFRNPVFFAEVPWTTVFDFFSKFSVGFWKFSVTKYADQQATD